MRSVIIRFLLPGAGALALLAAGASLALAKPNPQAADAALLGQGNAAVCAPGKAGEAHCHARVVIDRSNGKPRTTSVPSGYSPAQFRIAYGLTGSPTLINGHPPVIAIVDAYDDPNITKDLATYSRQFGVPNLPACSGPAAQSSKPCFEKINQNGGTSFSAASASWDLEIALDVEIAHGACPDCSILLVEADSANYSDLLAAEDRAAAEGAAVVSNSWGSAEFETETGFDGYFDHPGVAFTFSSGDSGYVPSYPAASPYVTAVGGTTLELNSDNSYKSESAWSGAGSGCSAYESKPGWQKDAGCATRTITDVSADADPNTGAAVYDSVRYQGRSGWFKVGGTSLASPLVASSYALGGVPAGSAANSLPYANAASLHDVITGSNGSCDGSYLCTATSAYDGPTGLGTPNGTTAF